MYLTFRFDHSKLREGRKRKIGNKKQLQTKPRSVFFLNKLLFEIRKNVASKSVYLSGLNRNNFFSRSKSVSDAW